MENKKPIIILDIICGNFREIYHEHPGTLVNLTLEDKSVDTGYVLIHKNGKTAFSKKWKSEYKNPNQQYLPMNENSFDMPVVIYNHKDIRSYESVKK